MLTDKEMEAIAKKYIDTEAEETNLDLVLFLNHTIKGVTDTTYKLRPAQAGMPMPVPVPVDLKTYWPRWRW